VSPALAAASLAPYLRDCGYRGRLLRSKFRFGDGKEAPLVGFAHEPTDARSACIAAVDGDGRAGDVVRELRQLGAPVFLVCTGQNVQWWMQGRAKPRQLETCSATALPQFFKKHADGLSPEAVYRAKTWGCFKPEYQLTFVDAGLMPLVDSEIGERLTDLIERTVRDLRAELWPGDISVEQGAWLLRSVFWLLAAKILRDKQVPAFASLDLHDVGHAVAAVARHYGATSAVSVGDARQKQALVSAARSISRFAHLGHVTTESLAYVYENALISKQTRQQLGTHSTPPYLVDYIVWHLAPWIEALPADQRHVFEPACGHAAFLVAALRLLKELLPRSRRRRPDRRDYLRKKLHGVDLDGSALELALLSLTLADIPNPNGWDLQRRDMFEAGLLEREASHAGVLLANPPFERFSPGEKSRYASQGIGLTCLSKPVEMLQRTLPHLRPGAVFGVVVPQGFLHSKEATGVRRLLAERFEISEICLFPDKMFTFSDHESAVLIGRRLPRQVSPRVATRYCRVRERDAEAFKRTFAVSAGQHIAQSRFSGEVGWSMRIPDLDEVWRWCSAAPRLSSLARVAKGLDYKGRDTDLPAGATTVSEERFAGAIRGFARWDRDIQIHEQPQEVWMNLDPAVIGTPRSGTTTGVPQVLLNYHPVSRGPWRLVGVLDEQGHPVTSSYVTVRPVSNDCPLELLWALYNSPVANAFMYAHALKRHNLVGLLRRIPVPVVSADGRQRVAEAAQRYLRALAASEAAMSREPNKVALKRLLLQMDAEVLRLYDLPPRYERRLLDTFARDQRPGVPTVFDRYYPEDYEPCFPLHEYLSQEYRRSTAGELRQRHKPLRPGPLLTALRKATELPEE